MTQADGSDLIVWALFPWQTLGPLVQIEYYLSIIIQPAWVLLLTMSIPLWPQCTHLLIAASSRKTWHFTKLRSPQPGILKQAMSSLDSDGFQGSDLNPIEHIWDVHLILSCQYGAKSLRNVSSIFLILCYEDHSEGKRESNSVLVSWVPVNVTSS